MNQRVSIPEEAVEAASSHAAIRMMEANEPKLHESVAHISTQEADDE